MALKLACGAPAKFEFDDGVSQTVVIIAPTDEPDSVRAKLQRVLELENGQSLPVRVPGVALQAAKEEFPPLYDAQAAEAAVGSAMGWREGDDYDHLPEHA